ncbi:MAG: putative transposase, partial [Thermotogaceae bacterium]|nr:putative transposase [Thermotogaceae bacterium]
NQAGKIVVEDLNIKGMLKNEKLSKYIHWNSWNKLIVILNYKAKRNGIELIKADRFYASSQICSVCGYKNEEVKDLNTRRWVCPECGREHDRDINAAINLANYVLIQEKVGRGPSEFKPVDHALAAERKENSSGLRVTMG